MNQQIPIFAAGWAELIGPLIVFVLYALGQLLSAKNNAPQRPPRPRPPVGGEPPIPGRPQVLPPQFGQAQPGQPQPEKIQDRLRGEVEEFLRQMQGEPPRRRSEPQKPQQKPRTLVVKVQPGEHVESLGLEGRTLESVGEHVKKHVSTSEIAQHVKRLGAEVGQADEKLESHLHEKFQHRLGALGHQELQAVVRKKTAASDIAEMLRSPKGMRQALIASEILKRPEI